MPNTVEEDNEVQKARKLRELRDRARIFREAFGTPQGKIVLEALTQGFGKGLPKNMCDDHGRTDIWQTARKLGHYDVLEYIRIQITTEDTDYVHPSRSSVK